MPRLRPHSLLRVVDGLITTIYCVPLAPPLIVTNSRDLNEFKGASYCDLIASLTLEAGMGNFFGKVYAYSDPPSVVVSSGRPAGNLSP